VLHEIVVHLRTGGAVLLLPAGSIEPDPAVHRHAAATLQTWSISIGLLARRLPNLCVVPAIVSGVLVRRYQRHPLTWIRRRAIDRQQLGATLQALARSSAPTSVCLAYGSPLRREALFASGPSARAITALVVEHARGLMPSRFTNANREAPCPECRSRSLSPWCAPPHRLLPRA
jgi:hypothetical protein